MSSNLEHLVSLLLLAGRYWLACSVLRNCRDRAMVSPEKHRVGLQQG